jgi:hypothetical protein
MKKAYEKPSAEFIQLRPEERTAACDNNGSENNEDSNCWNSDKKDHGNQSLCS